MKSTKTKRAQLPTTAPILRDGRKKKVDATKPITFEITQADIDAAKCKDPGKCVVAQALMRQYGDFFEACQIGSNNTKIVTSDKVTRFSTPSQLKRQIPVFDKTGLWHLPPGEYTLLPFIKKPNRWDKKFNTGLRPQDTFKARSIPSRRVVRIDDLCEIA